MVLLYQRSKTEMSLWQRNLLEEKQKATPDLTPTQYYLPLTQQDVSQVDSSRSVMCF